MTLRPVSIAVELLMAGNPSEGLRYRVIETPEKKRWAPEGGQFPRPAGEERR